ncbi:MAG TPA: cytochrome B6 [Planctomycetota bacterium]|nr:cytochrome B6 [Planctomycetota bacterium]
MQSLAPNPLYLFILFATMPLAGQQPPLGAPPAASKEFLQTMQAQAQKKPEITRTARADLERRFDLSGHTDPKARMSGGKPLPVGPTARLPEGTTWAALAAMTPAAMRERGAFPYQPIVHPLQVHGGGGMVFPEAQLKTHPELRRVDVDFDIPDAYLPEFPPPLYLTTHPDRGDLSKGQEVTLDNYYPLFAGVLTSFQLDGLRLLVTPFPQQQFNQTEDRATWQASTGVSCFSCHVNGHTTGQFHLVPDVQPHLDRPRIETVTLRGVFAMRTFGSKRNLRSIEDFTEVENNTAYFDGNLIDAERKGGRHFTRRELAAMAAFQNILDLPPAPKLRPTGELDPALATAQELRGEQLFHGRGKCAVCHSGEYFTDNLSHDLKVERFYQGRAEGLFKTFPLRGIKDSPPYLHDGRLLTLEDAVAFFDLVLELHLGEADKQDLVAFLRLL